MAADSRANQRRPRPAAISKNSNKDAPPVTWGVPLGGIGTGCIELGSDNRFRNITINNNRDVKTRISLSSRAFLAIRTVRQGRVQTRFLQPACELPFAEAGVVPAFTPVNELTWRALYPCSLYKLNAQDAPVELSWRAMTPVVPHDVAASNIPVLFLSVSVRNPGLTPVHVSFVFNWENLCGCSRGNYPARRGSFSPVYYRDKSDAAHFQGLSFGKSSDFENNAEGNYALMAQPQLGQEISVLGWNGGDPSELDTFWQQFHYDGRLANQVSRSPAAHSAAVCCTRELPPHQECRYLFGLSWYCPRFEVEGRDYGNRYTQTFDSAVDVGQRALRNVNFYFRSVENWQNALLASSLPHWFSRMLINSCATFSTNTLLTREGEFGMFETPEDPMTGCLDKRLYSSLATLLLFPELEEAEFKALASAIRKTEPGRCVRYLGRMGLDAPGDGPATDELADLGPKFVLMACRNFRITGKRQMAEKLFPRLQAAMAHVASLDKLGAGLPQQSGCSTMYEGWVAEGVNSYTSGLWIATLGAYAALAEVLGKTSEAERYRALSAKAVERFESLLWDEQHGYYLHCAPGSRERLQPEEWQLGCHTGQLAGEWYAGWLGAGPLFEPGRVLRALGTIQRLNERKFGMVKATMPDGYPCENPPGAEEDPYSEHGWPGMTLAHFACLLLQSGRPDHGLYMIKNIFRCVWMKGARAFNHPLSWDCNANKPRDRGQDRHMTALSVWHAYESLHGVFMDALEHVLWVRPHLPKGVRFLNVPLFSPAGLSWVRMEKEASPSNKTQVQLLFQQSVLLNKIVLGAELASMPCEVTCLTDTEAVEASIDRAEGKGEQLLHVRLIRPTVVQGMLSIVISSKGKRK
ncbi:MAG TPA: GH116 family glycosyl-hydrolase [Candidatus Hydrogenedentes bacterium]|nr:GH116 family glycosyl-hydrolase [Candidatus Hydrogenedentota bacterium]